MGPGEGQQIIRNPTNLPQMPVPPNVALLLGGGSGGHQGSHQDPSLCTGPVTAFFSITLGHESQDQFTFLWSGRPWTFRPPPYGVSIVLSQVCHRTVARDLEKLTVETVIHSSMDEVS